MATPGKLTVSPDEAPSGDDALLPDAGSSRVADSATEPDTESSRVTRPATAPDAESSRLTASTTKPDAESPRVTDSATEPGTESPPVTGATTEPDASRPATGPAASRSEAAAPPAEPDPSPPAAVPSPAAKSPRTWAWAAGIALTAAAAFAAWSAWSWHAAATAPTSTAGAARDEAVTAGRTLIATVTTFDPQHRDQALAHWQSATAGTLQTTLPSNVPPDGSATAGHVLDAGLSDLDAEAGTAKLLASVEITVTKDGTAQPIRRTRLAATMTRTASGWKLSSLEQLGVAGS